MSLISRLLRPRAPAAPAPVLNRQKTELIDFGCTAFHIGSLADLGAVWTVDGGYCLYAAEKHGVNPAIAVDAYPTPALREYAASNPAMKIVEGDFGSPEVAKKVGNVDAIAFFDILLCEVSPNWDELLRMYAGQTRTFLIFNAQFLGDKTYRLMDLPPDEYFRLVPESRDREPYKTAFERPNDIHPEQHRPYRDSFDLWQWAITDNSLTALMRDLGFRLHYYRNWGPYRGLDHVEIHAFAFSKHVPR